MVSLHAHLRPPFTPDAHLRSPFTPDAPSSSRATTFCPNTTRLLPLNARTSRSCRVLRASPVPRHQAPARLRAVCDELRGRPPAMKYAEVWLRCPRVDGAHDCPPADTLRASLRAETTRKTAREVLQVSDDGSRRAAGIGRHDSAPLKPER
ncbi:uncharacterized protein SCHCODRAFT_01192881, partial [Schizophyllum commune H4-8]|uniref:uncharacterized protein n=1 Tax=Schizophyllum commune (strain H4-8 / FGSC 9210) TaxID=578458 RepID=UPI00215FB925